MDFSFLKASRRSWFHRILALSNTHGMKRILHLSLFFFPFLIAQSVQAQGNDDCSLAVPEALAIGSSVVLSGDNSAANGIGDFVATSPYAGAPVYWVEFTTSACANITISYCGQAPVWANTLGILANSCPADQLVSANGFNDVECGDGNRTYHFDELPAGTWALPVLNDPGNNSSGAHQNHSLDLGEDVSKMMSHEDEARAFAKCSAKPGSILAVSNHEKPCNQQS